jgi:hypothetical protein
MELDRQIQTVEEYRTQVELDRRMQVEADHRAEKEETPPEKVDLWRVVPLVRLFHRSGKWKRPAMDSK